LRSLPEWHATREIVEKIQARSGASVGGAIEIFKGWTRSRPAFDETYAQAADYAKYRQIPNFMEERGRHRRLSHHDKWFAGVDDFNTSISAPIAPIRALPRR
jgi:hypothetical protein